MTNKHIDEAHKLTLQKIDRNISIAHQLLISAIQQLRNENQGNSELHNTLMKAFDYSYKASVQIETLERNIT